MSVVKRQKTTNEIVVATWVITEVMEVVVGVVEVVLVVDVVAVVR